MQVVHLDFERVFDVAQFGKPPRTCFSFESGGARVYSTEIPGFPRIESGMQVIALLGKNNDWQSLHAWINCETGEVACRSPLKALAYGTVLCSFIWVAPTKLGASAYWVLATQVVCAVFAAIALAQCFGTLATILRLKALLREHRRKA